MALAKSGLNKKISNLALEKRKENLEDATKVLSLTKAALVMVGDLAAITIKSFWPHPYYHAFCEHRRRSLQSTLSRLQKNGLVRRDLADNFFVLTDKGIKERKKILDRINLEKTKSDKWDGKWRVLVFDIPEKHKDYREFLRAELVEYGFKPLQKSVWISPYRSAEELRNSIEDRGMERWVKLVVAETVFDDSWLKGEFKL